MNATSLLPRLGLRPGALDARLAWAVVLLAVALYTLGYFAYYPSGPTVDDEDLYLEQTQLWLETGEFRVDKLDPRTGEAEPFVPGDYPVGMIALMAPFAAAFGRPGAFLASFACVLLAVFLTGRWLVREGRSPVFALILLAFPAAAVGGRLAMSDTARMALTALVCWLFFRALDGRRSGWLAAGFFAGAGLSLRESAVLPFIPLFAGTVLRRDRGWGWLLLGGLAGSALHLVANQAAFGSAFFVRGAAGYPFDLALETRLPIYLLGLLVLVPGGLWFALCYRGRRRPELLVTVVGFFAFYLFQAYGMTESGFAKRLVIALRYFDPLLPILAFMMAEALPRQLEGLLARFPGPGARRLTTVAALAWLAGACAIAFAVHPVLGRWGAAQASMRSTLEAHVPRDVVLITNGTAIRKFIDDLARPYETLWRTDLTADDLAQLRVRHGGFVVAFLDRSDSAYWLADAEQNAAFLRALPDAELVVDERVTATDRLRIWRIGAPRPAPAR